MKSLFYKLSSYYARQLGDSNNRKTRKENKKLLRKQARNRLKQELSEELK